MEEKLRNDLKQAQLMANEIIVATIRLVLSEVRNAQISKGEALSDEEIVGVIQKELKKRRESAESFQKGNRPELATREEAEAAVLDQYLPEQLPDDELSAIIKETIGSLNAQGIQDMGRVIAVVRGRVGQAADGGKISMLVKEQLSA
jgi:uncharacterized protein YqeY